MVDEKVRLNLGCSIKKIYGFINVDICPEVNPDIVDDSTKLAKFESNSVDLIYTSHMFEHLSREDSKRALRRWWEILKSGGILRIAVPDFEKLASHYMFYKNIKWITRFLNGAQKDPLDVHMMLYDEAFLREILEEVGFKDVKRYDHNKTEHFYVDDWSASYYPERHIPDDRTTPKPVLMSLNVECIK